MRHSSHPEFLHIYCFHPEGHFLEDPLISSIRDIRGKLIPMSSELLKAGINSFGTNPLQSSKGILHVISLIGKTITDQVFHPDDPVSVLRKTLKKENKIRLDECEALLLKNLNDLVTKVLETIESEVAIP